jgi:adenylate cyclase
MSLDLISIVSQFNFKMDKSSNKGFYEFEDFRLDAAHLLLCQNGQEIPLAPKVVETLLALVERHGEILSKDELMRIVWADSVVEEGNLSQNLYHLRKILKETATGKPLIETLRRRGYRFNGEIQTSDAKSSAVAANIPRNDASIAVLPFVNMSSDAENEYFCDGLAEELINALAKIADLKVAARTSAFSFKNKMVETGEIGKTLNVKTVLEGSVRRSGNRLRIMVQLINAADGYHLWSERYDRELRDIFGVQDEITLAVVDALKLKLFGEEKAAVLKRGTDNPEAHEFYLRGLFFFYRRTREDIGKAIELFKQAIEKDPNYALAYVGLTDCYLIIGVYSGIHASETLPPARAAATRALEIDDSSAEAHATMGHFYLRSLEWQKAEREIKRALELNPNHAMAHQWYSELFRAYRSFDKAMDEVQRAQPLDPLSPTFDTLLGLAYFNLGNSDAAFKKWQDVLEIAPNFIMTHFYLTDAYLKIGCFEEAIAEAQKTVDLSGRGSLFIGSLGYAYALSGKRAAALAAIEELKEKHTAGEAGGFNFAQVYTGLKDNDQAVFWLERDLETGNTIRLTNVTASYFYDHLSSDSRYQNLLRRMGIPADENAF